MAYRIVPMSARKRIALIAHDNCKSDLLAWARFNRDTLADHELHATGTTGLMLTQELGLDVMRFLSGPLGGDQQVGAGIVEGRIDFVIFFWDPCDCRLPSVIAPDAQRLRTAHRRTRTPRWRSSGA